MLRHSPVTSIIRFYDCEQSDDPFEPYVAVCTLIWENNSTVWVQGLHGKMSRKLFREFLSFCVDNGVKTIKAYRSPNHQLPLMKEVGDHLEISVDELVSRFGNPKP